MLNVLLSLNESRHRLAIVAGTSNCHIVQSQVGVFVKGHCFFQLVDERRGSVVYGTAYSLYHHHSRGVS